MRIPTLFAALLALIPVSPVRASETPLLFSLEAGGGMAFGRFHELVLPPAGHAAPYLSELIWDMNPRPTFDFRADILVYGTFRIGLTGSFLLPGECGHMRDYDWLYHNREEWTHFSESRNFLEEGFFGEVTLTWRFLRRETWWLEGGLSCGVLSLSFSDKLDFLYYTSWPESYSESGLEIYDEGDPFRDYFLYPGGSDAIDYRIVIISPSLIFGGGWSPIKRLDITSHIFFSPLSHYRGNDRHLGVNKEFTDTVFPWITLAAQVSTVFFLNSHVYLRLSGVVEGYPEWYGDSVTSDLEGYGESLSEDSIGFKGIFTRFSLTCGYVF